MQFLTDNEVVMQYILLKRRSKMINKRRSLDDLNQLFSIKKQCTLYKNEMEKRGIKKKKVKKLEKLLLAA